MDPSSPRGIGKYMGMALLLPISSFVGYLIGYGLDKLFHTSWIRFVVLILGSIAGLIELIHELNEDTTPSK